MIEVKKTLFQKFQEYKRQFYEDGKKRALELHVLKEDVKKEITHKNSVQELK